MDEVFSACSGVSSYAVVTGVQCTKTGSRNHSLGSCIDYLAQSSAGQGHGVGPLYVSCREHLMRSSDGYVYVSGFVYQCLRKPPYIQNISFSTVSPEHWAPCSLWTAFRACTPAKGDPPGSLSSLVQRLAIPDEWEGNRFSALTSNPTKVHDILRLAGRE